MQPEPFLSRASLLIQDSQHSSAAPLQSVNFTTSWDLPCIPSWDLQGKLVVKFSSIHRSISLRITFGQIFTAVASVTSPAAPACKSYQRATTCVLTNRASLQVCAPSLTHASNSSTRFRTHKLGLLAFCLQHCSCHIHVGGYRGAQDHSDLFSLRRHVTKRRGRRTHRVCAVATCNKACCRRLEATGADGCRACTSSERS